MSQFSKEVWIAGREVTKGKMNHAIRQQIPNHHSYKFDQEQFMDPANRREAEHDAVPGFWVRVDYDPGEPTVVVRTVEAARAHEAPTVEPKKGV